MFFLASHVHRYLMMFLKLQNWLVGLCFCVSPAVQPPTKIGQSKRQAESATSLLYIGVAPMLHVFWSFL